MKNYFASRVKRDYEDYTKLRSWFEDHNPFEAGEGLVAISASLTDVEGKITCDRVEEIGALIQNQITGQNFSECSFNGYSLSTKDASHKKRSRKASATIEIKETKLCVTDKNTFLSNYENKKAFVKCLAAKLRILGFQVFECPCDADTTTVKMVLEYSKKQPIIVYADDTDILSLLLHDYHNTPDLKDIFLTEMTRKSDHQHTNAIQ